MLGYTFYSKFGYNVLIKLVDSSVYDFVIEKNGKFKSVNVKKCHKNRRRWAFTLTANHNKHADIYLCWIPANKIFIEIKREQIEHRKSRFITIPPKMFDRALADSKARSE